MLTIGLVFMATAAVTFVYGPAPVPVRLPGYLKGQIDLGFRAFPTYRVVLIGVGLALMVPALARVRADAARCPDPGGGRQPAHGPVGRGSTSTGCSQLPSPSGSALAALGGGLAIDIVGLLADLRDPVSGVLPDRGRGRRHGEPWRRLPGRADPGFLDNAGKYLWPEGGGFFIYVVTVALLLARPEGLLARSRRG